MIATLMRVLFFGQCQASRVALYLLIQAGRDKVVTQASAARKMRVNTANKRICTL